MEHSRKRSRMGRDQGCKPRCPWSAVRSVAKWGEIGVADPSVWSIVRSVAGWGEIRVAHRGVWSTVGSVAGWGEIGVANLGFLCLEPPSLAGL